MEPNTPTRDKFFIKLFVTSMLIIIAIIGACETGIMMLFQYLSSQGIEFQPNLETFIDTGLLVLSSAPLFWFLSLRPLALKIEHERRESQKHAQLSNELHSVLNIYALISITDTSGGIIYANSQLCQISGYSTEELIGQDHRILNSGQHDKGFFANLWQTLSDGHAWQGEICNRNKEGQLYWVDATIVPLLDENGKPRQYISIFRDITIQKQTELNLVALRQALDASSEMIVVTNAKGLIQYANPALCQLSGWTEKELLGQSIELMDNPQADQKTLADMRNALLQGETWNGRLLSRRHVNASSVTEGLAITSDPLSYWAEISMTPILDADKNISGYVQIQRDISATIAKEAATQLELEDSNIRLAVSAALQQILPLETRLIEVLDKLLQLQSCLQQGIAVVLLKTQQENDFEPFVFKCPFEKTINLQGQFFSLGKAPVKAITNEVAILDFDPENQIKSLAPHGCYRVPLSFGEEILGLLIILTDPQPIRNNSRMAMLAQVGEMIALAIQQERAKEMLQESHDAAVQATNVKSEFLANMSHEIRTPMNGVLGMLDLLKDTELNNEQWDLVETAANSAEALLSIINDILDISKLEAGKFDLETIEFDLVALIEEVCSLLAGRAHGKGLELNCYVPVTLAARWLGDPTRIRQVLTNLIGNAIKFTDHGEVSITVIEINSDENCSALRIEIKDTGVGIAKEAQRHLFQPFSQADTSTARRYGGTGLGLSISSSLIALMGGTIGLESEPSQGSLFWFTLPLKHAENEAASQISDLSHFRVLIVDDNATNLQILNHYLKHWGFIVAEADNAITALTLLESATKSGVPYHLIMTDMHMPGMDGEALLRAINLRPDLAEIPKLLLSSGIIIADDVRKALGVSYVLTKPVRQAQLFEAMMNILKTSHISPVQPNKEVRNQITFPGKKILVVEDNKVNQKVIFSMLTKYELTVDMVGNGLEAIEQMKLQNYDLVLMDCQMPIMDGYEATRQLRAEELTSHAAHTPIIALTAHAAVGEREKCLAAGMDDYLSKPIERAKLANILSSWLGDSGNKVVGIEKAVIDEDRVKETLPEPCWDALATLNELEGDKELLIDLINLIATEAPVQLKKLQESYMGNDMPNLADCAHSIKGMAGHFFAKAIVGLASELELSARNAKTVDFQDMINELVNRMTRLIGQLQKELD